MQTVPTSIDLPARHFREIGRIIVAYSHIEWFLRKTTYDILGLDPKQGRLAVREPRSQDYPALYGDLLRAKGLTPPKSLKNVASQIEDVSTLRNMLAHGVWVKGSHYNKPVLQVVAGTWSPDKPSETIKRKIKPEGMAVPFEELREITHAIYRLSGVLVALRKEIVTLLNTLPNKSG